MKHIIFVQTKWFAIHFYVYLRIQLLQYLFKQKSMIIKVDGLSYQSKNENDKGFKTE
jgi:hypothetical protein